MDLSAARREISLAATELVRWLRPVFRAFRDALVGIARSLEMLGQAVAGGAALTASNYRRVTQRDLARHLIQCGYRPSQAQQRARELFGKPPVRSNHGYGPWQIAPRDKQGRFSFSAAQILAIQHAKYVYGPKMPMPPGVDELAGWEDGIE